MGLTIGTLHAFLGLVAIAPDPRNPSCPRGVAARNAHLLAPLGQHLAALAGRPTWKDALAARALQWPRPCSRACASMHLGVSRAFCDNFFACEPLCCNVRMYSFLHGRVVTASKLGPPATRRNLQQARTRL